MTRILRTFHAHSGNYTPGGNRPKWIIVHFTANTASAKQEATYANNDQHPSSYHAVLDGSGNIYQILDLTDTAWAVGAWPGATQLIGNNESVSIEVCNDGGPFTIDEIADLRWLVRRWMTELGIDADHVVRHFDAHTGRKECPQFYSGFNNKHWETLHDTITREDMMQVNDIMNAQVAYQDLGGKQVNKKFWELVSWGGHYAAYAAAQIPILNNKIIELEKKVDSQTAKINTMQKTLNAINKKIV